MRTFPCDRCGAQPGEWCVDPRGVVTAEHEPRRQAAIAADLLPVRDEWSV